MKNKLHNFLINQLFKNSAFEPADIDVDKKEISLGLWSLKLKFATNWHCFILSVLTRWFDYRFFETRFDSTWCDSEQTVHDNFIKYNSTIENYWNIKYGKRN